ncbi:MAG TPA: imidazole glycerol phosphate synthase subunit HisH [Candidatus Faeciplasma avium]|uniref:Imidazole glycerol phosphate synthase subunit HisH n=1 Tax=Candidatus Faeciplasma avium TaxID=2840798 RepID=A0A9D1T3V8_9FIRM|nr:imidazole glycerol phosphate synthase subunit HisH [Candidatus Faeciplasma avium]
MIAIIDYGVGNLFSLQASLEKIGAAAVLTSDKSAIRAADKIILPGVGAFEDASRRLFESGLAELIISETSSGKPILGICLGMQLLFDRSLEFGVHRGLGLIKGTVRPLSSILPAGLKIPQMGWNALSLNRPDCPIFKYSSDGEYVYFVHSFYGDCADESLAAVCEYGVPVTASVWNGSVYGCQFHPEKSGEVGLKILRAYSEL